MGISLNLYIALDNMDILTMFILTVQTKTHNHRQKYGGYQGEWGCEGMV